MTPADAAPLDRLAIQASVRPCHLARADLLRLLALAGFDHRDLAWRDVLLADDPMLVEPEAVRKMIEMAREAG